MVFRIIYFCSFVLKFLSMLYFTRLTVSFRSSVTSTCCERAPVRFSPLTVRFKTRALSTSLNDVDENNRLLSLQLPQNSNNENLLKLRHTAAHVMAMAVQRRYPGTQVAIGPWIDNGYVYKFNLPSQASCVYNHVFLILYSGFTTISICQVPFRRFRKMTCEASKKKWIGSLKTIIPL
jgi:hypothetical protein